MKKCSIFYSFLIMGLLAIVTSCSDDGAFIDQVNENDQVLENRDIMVDRPFKGEYKTFPKIKYFTPAGPVVEINAEGNATHLGKSTWYGLQLAKFTGEIVGYNFVFKAANGDRFWGTYDGEGFQEFPPYGLIEFDGYIYVEDGDGRFTGAKGTIHYYGEATLDEGILIFDYGTLTY